MQNMYLYIVHLSECIERVSNCYWFLLSLQCLIVCTNIIYSNCKFRETSWHDILG